MSRKPTKNHKRNGNPGKELASKTSRLNWKIIVPALAAVLAAVFAALTPPIYNNISNVLGNIISSGELPAKIYSVPTQKYGDNHKVFGKALVHQDRNPSVV